jgi:hypothetical protein
MTDATTQNTGGASTAPPADDMRAAMEYDVLQQLVKTLDRLLLSMADIEDMTDELDEAAEKAGNAADFEARAHREARAYRALRPMITAAMRGHRDIDEQMTTFLAASPDLAERLARWQADD